LATPEAFLHESPDGGCREWCSHVLPCGHACPKRCHRRVGGDANNNNNIGHHADVECPTCLEIDRAEQRARRELEAEHRRQREAHTAAAKEQFRAQQVQLELQQELQRARDDNALKQQQRADAAARQQLLQELTLEREIGAHNPDALQMVRRAQEEQEELRRKAEEHSALAAVAAAKAEERLEEMERRRAKAQAQVEQERKRWASKQCELEQRLRDACEAADVSARSCRSTAGATCRCRGRSCTRASSSGGAITTNTTSTSRSRSRSSAASPSPIPQQQ
jgi:hypothetical protein